MRTGCHDSAGYARNINKLVFGSRISRRERRQRTVILPVEGAGDTFNGASCSRSPAAIQRDSSGQSLCCLRPA
jgi:hypothetical protein